MMAANRMALVPVVVGVLLLLAQVEASDPGRLRRRLTKSIGADDEKAPLAAASTEADIIMGRAGMPWTLGESKGRPATVVYPESYDPDGDKLWPIILQLHGYHSDSYYHDHFFGLSARTTSLGFIALLANGTVDQWGNHFWNGINCCDFFHTHIDDVSYLLGLIQEAKDTLKVDPSRVYLMGHSNGGAMTQILACEHAEIFSAVASIAPGEIPNDCHPSKPLSIIEVIAVNDEIVPVSLCNKVIDTWRGNNHCPSQDPNVHEWRDYDCDDSKPYGDNTGFNQYHQFNCQLSGAETEVKEWQGCDQDTAVAAFYMNGATHNPNFSSKWSDDVIGWLLAH